MFGLGLNEWVLIGIVTLIVIKPRDFPKIAHQMGQWYRHCLRAYYGITDELTAIHEEVNSTVEKIQPPKHSRPQENSTDITQTDSGSR